MLKALELENFRAFSKRVRFEFRPITVLIGRNSSGKSSLLKWLQMARQSVEGDNEREFLTVNGPHVELGAWNDMRNKAARARKHRFILELEAQLREFTFNVRVERGNSLTGESEKDGKTVAYDGTPMARFRVTGDVMYQTDLAFGLQEILVENRDRRRLFSNTIRNLKGSSLLKPRRAESPDLLTAMADDLRFLEPARNVLEKMRHLSALRRESRGVIDLRMPPAGEAGHEGEHAMQHLVGILTDGGRKAPGQLDFILRHALSVLGIEDIKVARAGDGLLMRPEGRNIETRASHRLSDFGFGVSQALPVFVQGAIMNEGELLTVEQPEAQLHPTAQLELGSFFAELWKKRRVPSIIETHSSNILLRLRRLVRSGELPAEDVGVAYVHVEKGVTTVTNMPVKPDGELDGHLPMEFFGADLFEALEFNALPRPAVTGADHAG